MNLCYFAKNLNSSEFHFEMIKERSVYIVGWMQKGRKCILTIFQEEHFSVLQ